MSAQKIHVDYSGRLLVPVKVREAMGIKNGGDVMMLFNNNEITIHTLDIGLEKVHKIWAKYKTDIPLTEDLREMRREDAAKE